MAFANTVRRGLRSLARQRTVWVALVAVVVAVALALLVRTLARTWRRSYRYEGAASGPEDCKKSGKWWDETKCRKAEQCPGAVKDGRCVSAGGDDKPPAPEEKCAKSGKWWDASQTKCRKAEQCMGTVSNGACTPDSYGNMDAKKAKCAAVGKYWSIFRARCMRAANCPGEVRDGECVVARPDGMPAVARVIPVPAGQ